jgi:hypothetical protein
MPKAQRGAAELVRGYLMTASLDEGLLGAAHIPVSDP